MPSMYSRPCTNVWTTAMRGKRILVISAFAESIAEKTHPRENLRRGSVPRMYHNHDPSQTHASNDAREFSVELAEFLRSWIRWRTRMTSPRVCGGTPI
jgi:hypothetical protein